MAMQEVKLRRSERERPIVQLKGSGQWGCIAAGGVDALLEILVRPGY